MIIDKLHKRSLVRVEKSDIEARTLKCINDAKGNAMYVVFDLLEDVELKPGDVMTVDVRILIERK